MKTIDRYLIREYIKPLVYCLISFLILYVVLDFFGILDDVLKHRIMPLELLNYYASSLPFIFVQTLPFAVLVATLYTLGIFNRNNEITALKATGTSIYRVLLPLVVLGIFISSLTFLINETLVPKTSVITRTIRQERIKKGKSDGERRVFRNVTLYGSGNRMYYLGSYDAGRKTMNDVTVLRQDADNSVNTKITAPLVSWEKERWVFHDAVVSRYDGLTLQGKPERITELTLPGIEEKPEDFARAVIEDDFLNSRELKKEIARMSLAGHRPTRKIVDFHCRFAFPVTSIIVILIAVPFALGIKKGGALMGIGSSLIIGLIFYVVNYLSIALGKGGSLPPPLAAWLANIIFAAIGITLIIRTPK